MNEFCSQTSLQVDKVTSEEWGKNLFQIQALVIKSIVVL